MRNLFRSFTRDEGGAITVEWVFLTALVLGLTALVIAIINEVTGGLGTSVGEALSSIKLK